MIQSQEAEAGTPALNCEKEEELPRVSNEDCNLMNSSTTDKAEECWRIRARLERRSSFSFRLKNHPTSSELIPTADINPTIPSLPPPSAPSELGFSSGSFSLSTTEKIIPILRRKTSLETQLHFGIYQTQGPRSTMEDTYKVIPFQGNKSIRKVLSEDCEPDPSEQNPPHKKQKLVKRFSCNDLPDQFTDVTPAHSLNSEPSSESLTPSENIYAMFAVYDGHGGSEAAEYIKAHLHSNIVSQSSFPSNIEQAIREGFLQTDQAYTMLAKERGGKYAGSGTTACIALIYENKLYVANLGDSGAILYRGNKINKMTSSHTPKNPAERERIEKMGGIIWRDRLGHPTWNPNIVNIAVTRALGDIYFKHEKYTTKPSGMIAEPEISQLELTSDDNFLILASDGFWDVVSAEEAVRFVVEQGDRVGPDILSKLLIELALKHSTLDNATVLLVKFHNNSSI